MALLDRFRTSPDKDPDPALRLAWVEALPMDQRHLIAEVAREDPDARVRRAAVAKLLDSAVLAAIAKDDGDESVRAKAVEMLRDLALEVFEGTDEAASVAAVDAILDPKVLAHVAKSTLRESVGRRALARVTDERVLGSIARHAALEPIRRAALEAVEDPDEVMAIAMNAEFKDSAAAAVDRIAARGALEHIAARAKNKAAVKRARAKLHEVDEAAAQQAAIEVPLTPKPPDAARGERLPMVKPLEALAANEDLAAAEEALADADAGWGAVDPLAEADLAERFATAAAGVRERMTDARAQEADQVQASTQVPVEQSAANDAAIAQGAARRQARMLELLGEVEAAAGDPDLTAARRRFGIARREWHDLSAGMAVDQEMAARFAAAEARLAGRDAEAHDANARVRRDALNQLQQLATRVESLVSRPDITIKAGERALRDLRAALVNMPPLPSRQDYETISERLKVALTSLTPKIQELREAEDWKRFSNVAVQEQLIARMQALQSVDDLQAVTHQIRELQQQWRLAADVPRAQAEGLWRRFKAAHDEAWARCEAYFAVQTAERAENLTRKTALCDRAETLADSTRWIETAEAIKQLQAEWKTIGPVTRGREKAIWERFRSACDRFFTRRHDDLANRKKAWAENLVKKEALCVRAEALADSTDWDEAAASIKQLQAEWKTIGPVKKTRSEVVWQRFRSACDGFFERYGRRHEVARGERLAARDVVCAELEALTASDPGAEPPADLLATLRSIRGRWNQAVSVRGIDREHAAAFDRRFAAAFDAVLTRWPAAFRGTDLDPESNQRRMESLVKRVEDLAASLRQTAAQGTALSPTTRLAAMLKEALAANTIGGKVDEDSRWRTAAEDVRQAQASWARIGPVPEEARRPLTERFQRACRRITDAATPATRPVRSSPGGQGPSSST